MGQFFAHHTKW